MKSLAGLFLMLFIFPAAASAESVQAFVDRTRTRIDTPVQLTVSIPGRGGTVDTGGIRDFNIHSRGTSTQVQIINGRTREEQRHNYLLIPKRTGRLTVPALTVKMGGKTYRTKPIEIEVVKADAGSPGGGRDIQVQARVAEASPYIGQQLIYTFVLRYGVQIANTQYTAPDFEGFTAKQIGEQQSRQRVVAGRRYQEVTLSYLLIPMKTGDLVIDSAVLRCDTVVQENRRSGNARDRFFDDQFFSDSFFGRRRLTPRVLTADAVTVRVRPLPPATGSAPFSGLVGSFAMDAAVETDDLKVGDSVTLAVTVRGTGNIMDAEAPAVQVPDAFKQYTDSPESEIQLGPNGYQGKKVFRLALVAVSPGSHRVALSPATYFDPKAREYRPLAVTPLSLTVRESDQPLDAPVVFSAPADTGTLPGVLKKKVDFTGRDILPLKTGLDALRGHGNLSFAQFTMALALPALLFFLGICAMKIMQKNGNPAAIMTQKSTRALKQAAKTAGEPGEVFLSSLYRALVYGVCSAADTCSESLTYAEAREMLQSAGIPADQATRVSDLMKKIDSTRYSGQQLDTAVQKDLLTETTGLMKEVLR